MKIANRIEARLSGSTAMAYSRCISDSARSIAVLEVASRTYMDHLEGRSADSEFLDLATARRVAVGCQALMTRLGDNPSIGQHLAVQAAVDYFILEDDGEDDDSIVGFDDDLEVVRVTAEVLGWDLPEINA